MAFSKQIGVHLFVQDTTTPLHTRPELPILTYPVFVPFTLSHLRVSCSYTMVNGFKVCGIYLFDRDIFSEEDFVPSAVRDRPSETPSTESKDSRDPSHFLMETS
ncbi:Uncharacterized protein APZ42_017693 [Daphnia magna]|uniref:Uncharacterized protein n=1 Tax=Daphnia magna TaxID=35525 RepID=A0A165A0N3_9CRUS|nr:Uncharacterized protein APZ42_017693 [Daphnia magna]